MRPRPADPDQYAADRAGPRRVAIGWRLLGFILVAASAALLLASEPDDPLRRYGWIGLAAGWAMLIGVVLYRSRYRKARTAGPGGR